MVAKPGQGHRGVGVDTRGASLAFSAGGWTAAGLDRGMPRNCASVLKFRCSFASSTVAATPAMTAITSNISGQRFAGRGGEVAIRW